MEISALNRNGYLMTRRRTAGLGRNDPLIATGLSSSSYKDFFGDNSQIATTPITIH